MRRLTCICVALGSLLLSMPPSAETMCGYFRPVPVDIKQPGSEILQPSQVAFITWDPEKRIETVTVQPRFEGNALDFGMVIPTPSQPKLDEMPRDFFKALGVLTTPKKRAFPQSKLLVRPVPLGLDSGAPRAMAANEGKGGAPVEERPSTVAVLEVGQVGSLDYKIISAARADDLFTWLKDNKYSFTGDEATLNFYVQKKYFFTVMKIDTLQMKKNRDGSYTGDITPTRFSFASDKLVYPLKITQVSVKDTTEALFYVQAPFKVDLSGEMSYQYQWVSMMQQIVNTMGPGELTQTNAGWLKKINVAMPALVQRGQELGYTFQLGQPLQPNKQGRLPSTVEWAKRITAQDVGILAGTHPFSEAVPDPDDGFTPRDMRDADKAPIIARVIERRLQQYQREKPRGYLTRTATKEELASLPILKGHVREGQFLTRFRRTFTRAEMNDDLVLVPARVGEVDDVSEHEEVLRALIHRGPRGFGLPPLLERVP